MNSMIDSKISKSDPILVGSIIHQLPLYDLNPPYQRDLVWSAKQKRNLLLSIFRGIPINAIHLVEQNNSKRKYVLDGKQRISTIKQFVNNEIRLSAKELALPYSGCSDFGYSDLVSNKDENWIDACGRFLNHNVSCVCWGPMSLVQQSDIFDVINHAAPLVSYEKMYGRFFLARLILETVMHKCLKNLLPHLPKALQANEYRGKSFITIALTHSILLIGFGPRLDDVFAPRNRGSKCGLRPSAEYLHKLVLDTFQSETTSKIDDNMVAKMGLTEVFDIVKQVSDSFANVLSYKNAKVTKRLDKNIFQDIMLFLIDGFRKKILTRSFIQEHIGQFYDIVVEWADKKPDEHYELVVHAGGPGNIAKINDEIWKIYMRLGLDSNTKGKLPTPYDEFTARLKADSTCPINGMEITDTNIEIDHVEPKSKSSETDYVAVSPIGNNQKSNHSKDSMKRTLKYIESYT